MRDRCFLNVLILAIRGLVRIMTVNTVMPFLCSRAVVPYMREKKWAGS